MLYISPKKYKIFERILCLIAIILSFISFIFILWCDKQLDDHRVKMMEGKQEIIETVVNEPLPTDNVAKTEPVDIIVENPKIDETIIKTDESVELISLGKFKLTAYCSCIKCCGKYALNRPKDEDGKEIVYGSIGKRLISGFSIAVDPNVIPYETDVFINGKIYVAHDTGGAIKGRRIDIYISDHQKALNFGVQYAEVFVESK